MRITYTATLTEAWLVMLLLLYMYITGTFPSLVCGLATKLVNLPKLEKTGPVRRKRRIYVQLPSAGAVSLWGGRG